MAGEDKYLTQMLEMVRLGGSPNVDQWQIEVETYKESIFWGVGAKIQGETAKSSDWEFDFSIDLKPVIKQLLADPQVNLGERWNILKATFFPFESRYEYSIYWDQNTFDSFSELDVPDTPEDRQNLPIFDRWFNDVEIISQILKPEWEKLREGWTKINFKLHTWEGHSEWKCEAVFPSGQESITLDPETTKHFIAELVEYQDYAYVPDWNYMEANFAKKDLWMTRYYYWDYQWPTRNPKKPQTPELLHNPQNLLTMGHSMEAYQAEVSRRNAATIEQPVTLAQEEIEVLNKIVEELHNNITKPWWEMEMEFIIKGGEVKAEGLYIHHNRSRPYPTPENLNIKDSVLKLSSMAPQFGKSSFKKMKLHFNQDGDFSAGYYM